MAMPRAFAMSGVTSSETGTAIVRSSLPGSGLQHEHATMLRVQRRWRADADSRALDDPDPERAHQPMPPTRATMTASTISM